MNVFDEAISRAVQASTEGSLTLEFGRVKSYTNGRATLRLGDVDVPGVPVMKQYNPQQGDWAWVLRQGTLLVVIGCTAWTVSQTTKEGA